MIYEIMRKDIHIASADFDSQGNMAKFVKKEGCEDLLPLQECIATDSLRKWWEKRSVPMSQGGVGEMLKKADVDFPEEYLVKNLGLSLTDYYWIRPVDSNLTWSKVNLYENDFAENHLTDGKQSPVTRKRKTAGSTIFSYTPNASMQGQLEKSWIIRDGKRLLLKGNRDQLSSESINEVIATELHRLQGYDNYTEYKLAKIKGRPYVYGCVSEAFTTVDRELVSAYAVVTSEKKINSKSYFQHFIDVCGKHGIDKERLRADLEYQIVTDYVLSNSDRHLSNVSILRDSETLEFIRMAPIYDTGKAFFVGKPVPAKRKDLQELETVSFAGNENQLLKYVKNRKCVDISKLPDPSWIKAMYMKDKEQDERRVNAICRAYEMKVDLLEKWQRNKPTS